MGIARFLSVLPDNSSPDLIWRSRQGVERQSPRVLKAAGEHGVLRGSVEGTSALREREQETGGDQEERDRKGAGHRV